MTALLYAAPLVPLLAGLASMAGRRGRDFAFAAMGWAGIPALALALSPLAPAAHAPWILLGSTLALDSIARVALLLTAFLWSVAGLYARRYHAADPRRARFAGFFLLTMSGNVGLVIAADAVTFYFAFALMTFAAYGLVVHSATPAARRAGRVYLVMAVAGEAMLVAGLIVAAVSAPSLRLEAMAAGVAASPYRDSVIALLLAGFGIKAGALPLHVWLPLAHPVAPTPASAVLSGCMIKAGLLGWIRFLPLGAATLSEWGSLLILLGVLAAFFGVLLGITQRDPKTVLAYSSISQMGFMNVGIGVALTAPAEWAVALPAVLLYMLHHGLAKGALFLGVGVVEGTQRGTRAWRLSLVGMAFAGLALAGAPLTSGSVAKRYLKDVVALSPAPWPAWLDVLLPLAAMATTALMAVLLLRLREGATATTGGRHALPAGLVAPWLAALAAVALALWILPRAHPFGVEPPGFPYPALLLDATWPIAAGAAVIAAGIWLARSVPPGWRLPEIVPGDLVVLFDRVAGAIDRLRPMLLPAPAEVTSRFARHWYGLYAESARDDVALRRELAVTRWEVGATLLVVLVLALVLLFGITRG